MKFKNTFVSLLIALMTLPAAYASELVESSGSIKSQTGQVVKDFEVEVYGGRNPKYFPLLGDYFAISYVRDVPNANLRELHEDESAKSFADFLLTEGDLQAKESFCDELLRLDRNECASFIAENLLVKLMHLKNPVKPILYFKSSIPWSQDHVQILIPLKTSNNYLQISLAVWGD